MRRTMWPFVPLAVLAMIMFAGMAMATTSEVVNQQITKMTVEKIRTALGLSLPGGTEKPWDLPVRPPRLCDGCPHCDTLIHQTKKNRILPRIDCPKCGKEFRTQWARAPEDLELPRGPVVSDRFELGRNFANKIWNASRLILMNASSIDPSFNLSEVTKIKDLDRN